MDVCQIVSSSTIRNKIIFVFFFLNIKRTWTIIYVRINYTMYNLSL